MIGYTLGIIKTKKSSGARWAVKAVVGDEARYRGFYYKREAEEDMKTWKGYALDNFISEFHHNFCAAEEL